MPISVRVRFEVFKRDNFQCRYCGQSSPSVILEADHVVPVCEGGGDDLINLVTSCWSCNRGKSGVPLTEIITGEDPHDRAILLLERERQLREYNEVLRVVNERVEAELECLTDMWPTRLRGAELSGLRNAVEKYPQEMIYRAITLAIENGKTTGLAYVHACLNNWAGKATA